MLPRVAKVSFGGLVVLVVVSVVSAAAAANTVPPSYASDSSHPSDVMDFAPPECSHLTLTDIQIGPGGSGGGDKLILGSSASETLSGGGGDDCIVGGDGSDNLRGQGGNDVLIGGVGFLVILNGGGGYDRCYGGGWLFTIPISCEEYYD